MKSDVRFMKVFKDEAKNNAGAPAGVIVHNANYKHLSNTVKNIESFGNKSCKKTRGKEMAAKILEMAGSLGAKLVQIALKLLVVMGAIVTAYMLANVLTSLYPQLVADIELGFNRVIYSASAMQGGKFVTFVSNFFTNWENLSKDLHHAELAVLIGTFSVPLESMLWFKFLNLNRKFNVRRIWRTNLSKLRDTPVEEGTTCSNFKKEA